MCDGAILRTLWLRDIRDAVETFAVAEHTHEGIGEHSHGEYANAGHEHAQATAASEAAIVAAEVAAEAAQVAEAAAADAEESADDAEEEAEEEEEENPPDEVEPELPGEADAEAVDDETTPEHSHVLHRKV